MMLKLQTHSIKMLYRFGLAEGEGVGTAYEYFVKRLALGRFLSARPQTILLAGIPEKYGVSLDTLLLAEELGAQLTIVDERDWALEKMTHALQAAKAQGLLNQIVPDLRHVEDLTMLDSLGVTADLCLSPEVIQRLAAEKRETYIQALRQVASAVAIYAPNADNEAHTTLSGLAGLSLAEMQTLLRKYDQEASITYLDLPPFPPGMVRSDDQREQATSGRLEAVAMWGLAYYARVERFLPAAVRRKYAHIVAGFSGRV